MDAPTIFTMARELSNTNITDFSDARLLPFLNQVKNDLFSYLITGAGENYNWDVWHTNSVVNQTEYIIPQAASDTAGNLKITSIGINYNNLSYINGHLQYTQATEINPSSLPYDWQYYVNKQPISTPVFYIADNSIFIAPAPTSTNGAIVNGIQLKGIKNIINYTTTSLEADLHIPLYLHDVLVQGLLPYIHRAEGRKDEASFETKEYEKRRDLAVSKFKNRSKGTNSLHYPAPITITPPTDLSSTSYIVNL